MTGRTVPGLDARTCYSLVRSLTRDDDRNLYPTDASAYAALEEWSKAEGGADALFCITLGLDMGDPDNGPRRNPNNPADVAIVLTSYRWERVAVALAFHGDIQGRGPTPRSRFSDEPAAFGGAE